MSRFECLVAGTMLLFCLGSSSLAAARSATASQMQFEQQPHHITSEAQKTSSTSNPIWKDLAVVYNIYTQCANDNVSVCLKTKLLTALDRTLRKVKTLKLLDGVQFIKTADTSASVSGERAMSEKDIEATLPRSLEARESVLNNMILKKFAAFLQDHTLQVKFPDLDSDATANGADNTVEGRKKKDKKGGGAFIMIPLLLGGTFIPIAYGALAMLAGKALIVSKLALVLASIIGIKKLLSGGGKESSHEVVVSGGHSGWGRDFDLAYSGWKPAPHEQTKTM